MPNYLYQRLVTPREQSDHPFLILEDNTSLSYKKVCERINQFANCLVENGLQPGDRVAAQVNKSWQALALYLACVKAGGVFLPLNNAYTPREVEYFIHDAEPRFLVCDPDAKDTIGPVALSTGANLFTLSRAGGGSLSASADDCVADFEAITRDKEDLAAILYTSGTTGRSKGAMLTHDNLWSNAEVLTKSWQFSDQDVLLHALPVFHTHGLFVATNTCLVAGGSMIFLPGFQIDAMIERLPASTCMMGVPTFYTRLLDEPRFNRELVSHIRLFVSGSAPLLAETHIDFERRTGHRILERYGMTETSMNSSNPYAGERRAGTVGPPLPGVQIRVVSQKSGEPLPPGEIGSVLVKGPNVFKGYWKMPEKTAEEFTHDGFFITGDLGMFSSDGYLTIVGRDKDLIISGGYNIYPKEIEMVLDSLEGVTESAVIGAPHPDFGEAVVAILTGDSPPSEDQVKMLIKDDLAKFKQPKMIFTMDQLPRNSMGKVQKNILREKYAHCFQK